MTPQMVQIIHLGSGWKWTVFTGSKTLGRTCATFEAAWSEVNAAISQPGRTYPISARLDAEAG